ncbi:hypothetical protein P3709_25280, partial [Vibrio parahaemolyticus]|nr:hypothetical protein [Vibrio parahaemolyticus]
SCSHTSNKSNKSVSNSHCHKRPNLDVLITRVEPSALADKSEKGDEITFPTGFLALTRMILFVMLYYYI